MDLQLADYLFPEFSPNDLQNTSVLGLAHVGDGVYELMARTWLLSRGTATSQSLHKKTVRLVSASAQARACVKIWDLLGEDERAVFLRGRNTQVRTVPRNASRDEYQHATALEALFGFLYVTGRRARLNELFLAAVSDAV